MKQVNPSNWLDQNMSPGLLLVNGAGLLIINLLAKGLVEQGFLVMMVLCLNLLRKKRINYFMQLFFLAAVTLLNLYPPYGRVLFRIFGLPVTADSLQEGFSRALMLSAFLLIARYGINPALRIPGSFGSILSRTLYFLGRLQQHRLRLATKGFLKQIDELILDLWQDRASREDRRAYKSTIKGILFVIGNMLLIIILLYLIKWITPIIEWQ